MGQESPDRPPDRPCSATNCIANSTHGISNGISGAIHGTGHSTGRLLHRAGRTVNGCTGCCSHGTSGTPDRFPHSPGSSTDRIHRPYRDPLVIRV